MHEKTNLEMLDAATQKRLAKLVDVPVETQAVERRLRNLLAQTSAASTSTDTSPLPAPIPISRDLRWNKLLRPIAALAAALLLASLLGLLVMSLGQSPTIAAPADLAQLHKENLEGHAKVTLVSSIEQARSILAGKWNDLPDIPASADMQLHACCIHDFLDSKVACLFLMDGSTQLTLVVGHAKTFQPAPGEQVTRQGRTFTLHQVNGLHMVMMQDQDRFVCLMGQTTRQRLLAIAEELTF